MRMKRKLHDCRLKPKQKLLADVVEGQEAEALVVRAGLVPVDSRDVVPQDLVVAVVEIADLVAEDRM